MGDYLKNGAKIGTCGQAYYATKKALEAVRHDEEAAAYLNPENGCSFAFPFPEYDGKAVGEISNFHDGERADYFFKLPKGSGIHGTITHHIHPKGAEGINLFIPCPYSAGSNTSRNFNPEFETFRLTSEKYENGKIRVMVECVYCGEKQLLTDSEIKMAIQNFAMQSEKAISYHNQQVYLHPDCDNSGSFKKAQNLKEVSERLKAYLEPELIEA